MTNCKSHQFWRLLAVFWILCASITKISGDRDKCTDDRSGLPACNFNFKDLCNWDTPNKKKPVAWIQGGGRDAPLPEYEDKFIYLDYKETGGNFEDIDAILSKGLESICVRFFYATSGAEGTTVNIKFYDGEGEYQLAHTVQANTGGNWESTSFSCCLPNVQSGKRYILLQSAAPKDGVVGVDFMDLNKSSRSCPGDKLVCLPSPYGDNTTTLAPTTTNIYTTDTATTSQHIQTTTDILTSTKSPDETTQPPTETTHQSTHQSTQATVSTTKRTQFGPIPLPNTCPGGLLAPGAASCDFGNPQSAKCGWQLERTWGRSMSVDGRDKYVYSMTGADSMTSDLDSDVTAICMEVHFRPADEAESLRNIFSVDVVGSENSVRWAESYDYKNSGATVWKSNSFVGCVGFGEGRKLKLMSNKIGLRIKNIVIKMSDDSSCKRATPSPTQMADVVISSTQSADIAESTAQSVVDSTASESQGESSTEPDNNANKNGQSGPSAAEEPKGDNTPAIAGGAAGGVVLVIALAVGVLWYRRRQKSAQSKGKYVYSKSVQDGGTEQHRQIVVENVVYDSYHA